MRGGFRLSFEYFFRGDFFFLEEFIRRVEGSLEEEML